MKNVNLNAKKNPFAFMLLKNLLEEKLITQAEYINACELLAEEQKAV